jgi:hypothetical protein
MKGRIAIPVVLAVAAACAHPAAPGPAAPAPTPPSAALERPAQGQRACPAVLARGQSQVSDIAVSRDRLYWVAEGTAQAGLLDGAIRRVGLDGSGLETVVSEAGPRGLLVDATGVFWTSEPTVRKDGHVFGAPPEARAGAIWFLAGGQGSPRVLVPAVADPLILPSGGDWLFFSSGRGRAVLGAPRAGGPARVIGEASGRVSHIALDATHVYFTVDEYHKGEVGRVPRAGGQVEILAGDLDRPWGIALDEGSVYFTTHGGYLGAQLLGRVAKTGGAYQRLASLPRPKQLVREGDWLYVATERGVAKVRRDGGGDPVFLSAAATRVLAVDGNYVYAAEPGDDIVCVMDRRD